MKALSWRALFAPRPQTDQPALPRLPIVRWLPVGCGAARVALRAFDWNADEKTICLWQRETYALNFPDFQFTPEFSAAFRHDLRRAALDENNGLFVVTQIAADHPAGTLCGFVWLVLCHNNWTGERYGYINNLYVNPANRGEGLGDELLRHAESWFKARRVTRLRLTVTSSNSAACRLYERMGYSTQRWEMEKQIGENESEAPR